MVLNVKKGFTLVEMIVVIAIIAILAAVIIPTTAGFIDRSRLSNDRQTAAQMTRVLTTLGIEAEANQIEFIDWENMTAAALRDKLNEFGEPFDFTPKARDTGYFFVENGNRSRIVALKYTDALGGIPIDTVSHPIGYTYLSLQRVSAVNRGDNPEEFFGVGTRLLTDEGLIGGIIAFLASGGISGTNIGQNYQEIRDEVNRAGGLLGSLLGQNLLTVANELLDTYDPSITLYVSDTDWATTATDGANIQRIVFASNIARIPKYNASITGINLNSIQLPASVKQVFDDFSFISEDSRETLVIESRGNHTLHIDPTITLVVDPKFNSILFNPDVLINYSQEILFEKIVDGNYDVTGFNYNLSNLSIRQDIVGYSVQTFGSRFRIELYTRQGFVGYATNQTFRLTYEVNYVGAQYGGFYAEQHVRFNNFFTSDLPNPPTRAGYTFEGWYLDEAGLQPFIIGGKAMIQSDLVLYAKWSQ